MIVKSKLLFVLFPKWVAGVTIFGRIFIKDGSSLSDRLLTHEYVHVVQQRKLGYAKFYLLYVWLFLLKFLQLRDFKKAYREIPFEEQAYRVQKKYPAIAARLQRKITS